MTEFVKHPEHGPNYQGLSSGRSFYAYKSVVGINQDGRLFTGWDEEEEGVCIRSGEKGNLDFDVPNLTCGEKREIARVMIERWENFGGFGAFTVAKRDAKEEGG